MGSIETESGPITRFPADDLRASQRFITSHNGRGEGIFVATDNGDHHRVMVNGKGVANIIYSTKENPVSVASEADIEYARKNEVSHNQELATLPIPKFDNPTAWHTRS